MKGARVRRKEGEKTTGVVIRQSQNLVTVSFPEGTVSLHFDDLEFLNEETTSTHWDDSKKALLRAQAIFLEHARRYDPLSGLSSSRIEPQPHQVYTAHRVSKKLKPRMILADEVGLGKTIEAGLILKELRARELAQRVLVISPANLVFQWQSEMKLKFNETFEIMDRHSARHFGRGNQNPWHQSDSVITSLSFATSKRQRERIVESNWDLVIIDEAHRVRRTKRGNSLKSTIAYDLIDEIKESTLGLLLLTATPLQLHRFELYSLIELVEPGLYATFEQYERVHRDVPVLNAAMKDLIQWPEADEEQKQQIIKSHRDSLSVRGIELSRLDSRNIEEVTDEIAARHPLSQVLIRNRKRELGIGTERIAKRFLISPSDHEASVYAQVEAYLRYGHNLSRRHKNPTLGFLMTTYYKMLTSSSQALYKSLGNRVSRLESVRQKSLENKREMASDSLSPEQLLEIQDDMSELEKVYGPPEEIEYEISLLKPLIEALRNTHDSKGAHLLKIIRTIDETEPGAKIVIFTQFVETIHFLQGLLSTLNRFSCSVFHGALSPDAKEDEIRKFRDVNQILLTSEAGGEGRNLQFAHYLINYDLPWNPMKVEQRIGRVDRIGQRHPVVIYNLAYEDTVESRVLELLENRIGIFESSVGSLDSILGEVERDLSEIVFLEDALAAQKIEEFEIDLGQRITAAKTTERLYGDLLLDRNSFRRDRANELLRQGPMASHEELHRFTATALVSLGGRVEPHDQVGEHIVLTEDAAKALRVRKRTYHGCFDPNLASRHEELDFFAFGHELIDRVLEFHGRTDIAGIWGRFVQEDLPGDCLEWIQRVKIGGLRPSSILIRGLANASGLVSVETSVRPNVFDSHYQEDEVPNWLPMGKEILEVAVFNKAAEIREQLKADHQITRAEEFSRVDRIFEQKRLRIQEDLNEQETWLVDNENSLSPRIQRVVPARRGRVTRLRERLSKVEEEHLLARAQIESKTVEVEFEDLWIGLVRSRH
jgi:SNF2 family DNA or RNA helicase